MKKKFYLTLDTETCTLPFANEICKNARDKQKIAIAKPLVYDIGWVITDRQGNIIKQENFLIQETFFVPTIFNTAYYKDKRPIYMELLEQGKIKACTWDNAMDVLEKDLQVCDISTAYNACFDYKKAIPFTERYIRALHSNDYESYEKAQKDSAEKIIGGNDESHNDRYLLPVFDFRGKEYPIADLWGIACNTLINNERYKRYCMKNELFTNSVEYFKTSAETTFQYVTKDFDFIESHTALDDSIIESQILTKALKRGKIEPTIESFPFRNLGTTYDFALTHKEYLQIVFNALEKYVNDNNAFERRGAYWIKVQRAFIRLKYHLENE